VLDQLLFMLAKRRGARVVAISSKSKQDLVQEIGADDSC
jgi:NADPH:quinone reductase-like Zn-dependent oxidoreductase